MKRGLKSATGGLPRCVRYACILVMVSVCWWISGCAPSLYSINMKYVPSNIPRSTVAGQAKFVVTVAGFEDRRNVPDKMMIGKVITSEGKGGIHRFGRTTLLGFDGIINSSGLGKYPDRREH